MKYLKKYNKFNLTTKCRICLTQSVTKMKSLDEPLKGELLTPRPLVYEAIELVMSEKVKKSSKFPNSVCVMCSELLKISYDLKTQYLQSQKNLEEQLRDLGELSDEDDSANTVEPTQDKDSVEIVVGSQKFNIHDLLIVEDDDDDSETYEGFLNNLGKSVSASFVKKGYKKPKPVAESPTLVIEKVSQDEDKSPVENQENSPETPCDLFFERLETHNSNMEDMLKEISSDVACSGQNNDAIFIDTPVSDEIVRKFVVVTENDKEALESAMSLKYKCPFCQKPMSSLKRVKLHSRLCGKNNLNARCLVCNKTFGYRKQLLKHLKFAHFMGVKKSDDLKLDLKGINEEINKFKCNTCGKTFNSNGSLFYHMSKHSGRRYDCDKCDKKFYTKSQATSHRQTHNRNDTLVVCPICGKGFHYQSGLFYHMKMHTNERNYQCSYCIRKFYTRNSLKRHELTHTGGRPYDCKYCDKKFRSLGEVKKHILLHTGERPFQCKYCALGFTQAHNLKMHLMTHPGNFQCGYCSRGFAEKEILRFHLRTKHGETNEEIYMEADDSLEAVEQIEEDIDDESEIIPGKDLILEEGEEYFITEEYIDEEDGSDMSLVKTYEVRDEVLVETVEES